MSETLHCSSSFLSCQVIFSAARWDIDEDEEDDDDDDDEEDNEEEDDEGISRIWMLVSLR